MANPAQTSRELQPNAPKGKNLFPYTRRLGHFLLEETREFIEALGLGIYYTGDIIRFLLKGKLNLKHFMHQAAFIGFDSLMIALILTTFSGMVIALQVAKEMVKQGAGNFVGGLVTLAVIRELAPIMTGFAVIALAGSAFAAELSTMKITNQIDALKVLRVNPIRYLVVPRVLSATLAMPLMVIITAFSGIMGGMFVSNALADLHPGVYLDSVWYQLHPKDIVACLTKSAVFGYLTAITATSIGINTRGGAREVGLATTRAVVWSFVLNTISDYFLTYLFYGN